MSTLKIEILELTDVKPHSNADLLELAIIKGWQTVIKKGSFKNGDQVVYFPIDCVLPIALSDYLNVTNYLSRVELNIIDSLVQNIALFMLKITKVSKNKIESATSCTFF